MHASIPTLLFAFGSAFVPQVEAHGFVQGIRNNGKWYPGYQPWWVGSPWPHDKSAGWPSANQDWGYVSPGNYSNMNIACGTAATPGETFITVASGSKVDLLWTGWPESHHGPVLTYMAKCPGDCTKMDKNNLNFFKIDAAGMTSSGEVPGAWASDALVANNNTWTVTIPKTLAPGGYVLRHEIIALHSADKVNGAQSYPQCINLKVTGTGTAAPVGVKATSLYKYKGAGIYVSIWYPALISYRIPGPAIWQGATKRWLEKTFSA